MLDAAECKREWRGFREMMADGLRAKDFTDLTSFLKFFFGGTYPGSSLFPVLSSLFFILCVLPVGSCSVERSFSTMKRIQSFFILHPVNNWENLLFRGSVVKAWDDNSEVPIYNTRLWNADLPEANVHRAGESSWAPVGES